MTPEQITAAVAAGLPSAARCETEHGQVTLTVPAPEWLTALTFARDTLACDFFDWLTAVDEQDDGLAVVVHVYSLSGRHHLLVRTLLAAGEVTLPTATGTYRGAAWHERETHEMFGVFFDGHPGLVPLLLPDGFEGHPLRKDFVLAARAAKEWPGAHEPGEREATGRAAARRARRRLPPPGVPEGWQPQ